MNTVLPDELVLQNRLMIGDDFYDRDFDWTPYAPRRHVSRHALPTLTLSPFHRSPQQPSQDLQKSRKVANKVRFCNGNEIVPRSNTLEAGLFDSALLWWTPEELKTMQRQVLLDAEQFARTHPEITSWKPCGLATPIHAGMDKLLGLESLIFPMLQTRRRYAIRHALSTQQRLLHLPPEARSHLLALQCRQGSQMAAAWAYAMAQALHEQCAE